MHVESYEKAELFAWIGEDEFGSGKVGLKQGFTQAGLIPLVAMSFDRAKMERLLPQMNAQAEKYGKKIRLCRFVFQGVALATIEGK